MPVRNVLELGRLAAVIVVTAVAGLGIASLLSGSGDEEQESTGTGEVLGLRTSGGEPEGGRVQSAPAAASKPVVRVRDATLAPAMTVNGRARNRARLTLAVRVSNQAAEPVDLDPRVLVAGTVIAADPAAPDALSGSVPAGGELAGVLRFELGGKLTSRLRGEKRVQLRVGGRTVPTRVAIVPVPPSP